MKRKTRIININNRSYVWWYNIGNYTYLHISPYNDKTSVITIEFNYDDNGKSQSTEEFAEYIIMNKENTEYCIKTISPKMIALILSYLSPDAFMPRKNTVYNGFNLLSQFRFTVCNIKPGLYW